MTETRISYAVTYDEPTATMALESQLIAAGLRRGMGPGREWRNYETARMVLVGLLGTPQAQGLRYEAGIRFITEWMGC
uniref:Uncharacterized protein n=1 Tax=viral metagenome TaxID=1070528 RepID=A0A6M3JGI4_9ZZZZ